MIGGLCYALLLAAFVVDILTPQLLVVSILLNVPIALSSLALRRRFTIQLVVLSELANLIAGYTNVLRAGPHYDAIAVGDRLLLAASFLLVGYMTIRTQELGRAAGLSDARAEQAHRERRLRLALDAVRESLNTEYVMRAIVREAAALLDADRAMFFIDAVSLDAPKRYVALLGEREVRTDESRMDAGVRSLLARAAESARAYDGNGTDTVARYALEALGARSILAATLSPGDGALPLVALRDNEREFSRDDARLLTLFAEQAAIALAQARLFTRIAEQSEQIAEQHKRLLERSGVIRDLVYALAHDLRTPLAAANVTMQQAQRGAYGDLPESYRDVLTTTIRSNEALQRMVETLLLVARYESGDLPEPNDRVDLGAVAADVVREFEPAARERGAVIACDSQPAFVRGDQGELRRAVTNLVANAIEASPSAGTIGVRVVNSGEHVRVDVEDEGFGVPENERQRLFQRFGASVRRRGGGTGLGLYIVRAIAQRHGGSATYAAREKGSRFTLTLPSLRDA